VADFLLKSFCVRRDRESVWPADLHFAAILDYDLCAHPILNDLTTAHNQVDLLAASNKDIQVE
jgi:hypothetical protein